MKWTETYGRRCDGLEEGSFRHQAAARSSMGDWCRFPLWAMARSLRQYRDHEGWSIRPPALPPPWRAAHSSSTAVARGGPPGFPASKTSAHPGACGAGQRHVQWPHKRRSRRPHCSPVLEGIQRRKAVFSGAVHTTASPTTHTTPPGAVLSSSATIGRIHRAFLSRSRLSTPEGVSI